MGTVVLEGYGQTETAAAVSTTLEEDQVGAGFVGVPLPCSEIALFDVPEMNYTQADVIDGKRVERGEICFRGPNMTAGYWKMPEKTAEMIDAEGWLHSGDIGMWTEKWIFKDHRSKEEHLQALAGRVCCPRKGGECVRGISVYSPSIRIRRLVKALASSYPCAR